MCCRYTWCRLYITEEIIDIVRIHHRRDIIGVEIIEAIFTT
jgi:hypothetical protein